MHVRQFETVQWLPSPFKSVMTVLADGLTVPGDSEGKCGFVAHSYRNGGLQQIPLSLLPLAVPFDLTRKLPNRIGSRCWTVLFLGKLRRYLGAHRVIDRGRDARWRCRKASRNRCRIDETAIWNSPAPSSTMALATAG